MVQGIARKQQRDTEEMLDRISSFDERLLYVGITIVVKASSREELEERTEKVRIIGKTHNMDIVPHSHRQLDALNTSLPTGARFVNTMRTITSEELSIFIPFNVQEIHDNLGYCYGFNKVSKNLIIGNRKLLKNGNGMVFGVPGSGKSTLIRDVFAKQYSDRVILVDQSPVTATGRSTPATFLGFFDEIRKVLALENHQNASLFTFNGKGA